MIYNSLIQPHFDYCDVVWGSLNNEQTKRIQKLQNRAARIITFQNYDARSADILKSLRWDNLALRREKHLALMMYDTINGSGPENLSKLFKKFSVTNP